MKGDISCCETGSVLSHHNVANAMPTEPVAGFRGYFSFVVCFNIYIAAAVGYTALVQVVALSTRRGSPVGS